MISKAPCSSSRTTSTSSLDASKVRQWRTADSDQQRDWLENRAALVLTFKLILFCLSAEFWSINDRRLKVFDNLEACKKATYKNQLAAE